MKKCQMHNKKKRQALLDCNAALFGCNWRVCLSLFGPSPWFQATGSWMSYADLAPATTCLCSLAPRPSALGAEPGRVEQHGSRRLLSSTSLALVDPSVETQWSPPAFKGGLGEAAVMPLHARCCWTCCSWADPEHALQERKPPQSRSVLHQGYRAQNSPLASTGTDNSDAVVGKENLPTALTPSSCYSCISCYQPSQWELFRGSKSFPNGEEAARWEIVATHQYTRVLLLLRTARGTGRRVMCLY